MARYGAGYYSEDISLGGFYYGQSPQLSLSVEPFLAVATSYSTISVTWTPPSGDFVKFRLLRNQEGVPDNEEDGVLLVESTDVTGAVQNLNKFVDGVDNTGVGTVALIPGKFVYYAIWLLLSDGAWYPAGYADTILAKDHSTVLGSELNGTTRTRTTHEKVLDLLPRVYTSATESPLDVVDYESDLSKFLYGFSYTLDEFMTYVDLLAPEHTFTSIPPALLNARSADMGLTTDNRSSTKYQRRLLREALWAYSRKGTATALGTIIESMTGYAPEVTTSRNMMLSLQDSTFFEGVGNWTTIGACTLTSDVYTITPTYTDEPLAIETQAVGKVVVATSGAKITNGTLQPITQGIPVTAGTEYSFRFWTKKSSGTIGLVATISWYDRHGTLISTNSNSSYSTTTSWTTSVVTATAPTLVTGVGAHLEAVYAGITITASGTGTYYIDMTQFSTSATNGAYEESRAANVRLLPNKTNLIIDPSFEGSLSSWSVTATAHSAVTGNAIPGIFSGIKSLEVTGKSSPNVTTVTLASPINVTAGQYYTFSIYAKADSGTIPVTFKIQASTSSDSANGGSSNSIFNTYEDPEAASPTSIATLTTTWTRHAVTLYVPETYSAPTLNVSVYGSIDGAIFLLDAAQLEANYKASDYFDGSNVVNGAEWDGGSGNAHNAVSYLFQNKGVKLARLETEIVKYLPRRTPYVVSSQDGVEFKGIAY